MESKSREDFEAWYRLNWGHTEDNEDSMFEVSACHGSYHRLGVRMAYDAWQASRSALVVELPEPHAHLIWIQAGHGPDDYWDDVEVSRSEKDKCCDGSPRYRVYSEFEVEEMLRSAGITVKGEGDEKANL